MQTCRHYLNVSDAVCNFLKLHSIQMLLIFETRILTWSWDDEEPQWQNSWLQSKESPLPRSAPLSAPTRSPSCQTCAGQSAGPGRTDWNSTMSALHKCTVTWICNSGWPQSGTLMSCSAASRHQWTLRAQTLLWKKNLLSITKKIRHYVKMKPDYYKICGIIRLHTFYKALYVNWFS